jgi:hypothetical protein
MNENQEAFEDLWDNLLSRNPKRIWESFDALDVDQQQAVQEHLERMIHEPGWQPEQRISAQTALDAITNLND